VRRAACQWCAGADGILDYEFLAEMTRENVGDDPTGDIRRSTGRKGHDHRDRSRRIILGLGAIHCGRDQKRGRSGP